MRRAVVLGAYGLIGSACARALRQAGFHVTGIGRSHRAAMAADPAGDWVIRDIPAIAVEEWRAILAGADVVVNASGALQDGGRDDLAAIHVSAVARLTQAMDGTPARLIQISAAGVSPDSDTAFFRTKARGDAIIADTARDWVILRPTLVLAPDAYGGTALLRGAAGLPGAMPRVFAGSQVQTVHVDDVADAVVAAATGQVAGGATYDLTEAATRRFPDLVARMRRWLGFGPPLIAPPIPAFLLAMTGRVADLLGHLGWRSPLRSNALAALAAGIHGDPSAWNAAGGRPCRSLDETLATLPATRQERLFARAYFALPLAIGTLSLFWCLSGLITLIDVGGATKILTVRGTVPWLATVFVIGGAFADLALGLAILWRPWVRGAASGMIVLSAGYLGGSLLTAPDLWADPLGPMVKVLPGMTLAGVVALWMEDR